MKRAVLILVCLLILTFVSGACKALNVSSGELKNALDNSSAGDTLFLENGVFKGSFEISTSLIIIGDSGAVIDGDGIGDVLTITADAVVLKNVTVQNSGTRLLKDHAGIKITGHQAKIVNCVIRDDLHGIYVKAGTGALIHGNTIVGRFNIQESDRGNGIHLWNTRDNLIVDNDIRYARDGIYFSFAHNTEIRNNHIHDLRYGLHYMYSDSNSFEDNLFDNNVAGSALMFSEEITFKRNVFAHCRGMRAYGILLQSVEYCHATDNLILDNTRGIFFDDANNCRFESNDIVQNDLALQINASCESNTLVNNHFISNLAEVSLDASILKSTYWSENQRGNFWSGYDGYDLNNDDVGDIPHKMQSVFEYMEQDNPAIRFYLYSPAALLLAAAEKRLPILRKSIVEDPHPIFRLEKNNNVPWAKLDDYKFDLSLWHIMIWLAFLILPFGLLLRIRK